MGFKVLTPDKSELLIEKLNLIIEPQLKDISHEEYEKVVKLNIDKPLDMVVSQVNRVEHGYLRKFLFGKGLYVLVVVILILFHNFLQLISRNDPIVI